MRGRFHTGVAPTHVHQRHTKATRSRHHRLLDDGGLVGKAAKAEWAPHVAAKRRQHQAEDVARRLRSPMAGMPSMPLPWTSLGEAPTEAQVQGNDLEGV